MPGLSKGMARELRTKDQKLGLCLTGDLAYFMGCVAIVENQLSRDGDGIRATGYCRWNPDLAQPIGPAQPQTSDQTNQARNSMRKSHFRFVRRWLCHWTVHRGPNRVEWAGKNKVPLSMTETWEMMTPD